MNTRFYSWLLFFNLGPEHWALWNTIRELTPPILFLQARWSWCPCRPTAHLKVGVPRWLTPDTLPPRPRSPSRTWTTAPSGIVTSAQATRATPSIFRWVTTSLKQRICFWIKSSPTSSSQFGSKLFNYQSNSYSPVARCVCLKQQQHRNLSQIVAVCQSLVFRGRD